MSGVGRVVGVLFVLLMATSVSATEQRLLRDVHVGTKLDLTAPIDFPAGQASMYYIKPYLLDYFRDLHGNPEVGDTFCMIERYPTVATPTGEWQVTSNIEAYDPDTGAYQGTIIKLASAAPSAPEIRLTCVNDLQVKNLPVTDITLQEWEDQYTEQVNDGLRPTTDDFEEIFAGVFVPHW